MTSETEPMTKPKKAKACPICRQPMEERYKPFCSKRCADVDLGRWLGERYVVPGDAPLEPGEEAAIPDDSDEA